LLDAGRFEAVRGELVVMRVSVGGSVQMSIA
jgi:hypothetical protein